MHECRPLDALSARYAALREGPDGDAGIWSAVQQSAARRACASGVAAACAYEQSSAFEHSRANVSTSLEQAANAPQLEDYSDDVAMMANERVALHRHAALELRKLREAILDERTAMLAAMERTLHVSSLPPSDDHHTHEEELVDRVREIEKLMLSLTSGKGSRKAAANGTPRPEEISSPPPERVGMHARVPRSSTVGTVETAATAWVRATIVPRF